MDCRIENKGELRLLVYFQDFDKETSKQGIPALWDKHHQGVIGGGVSCYFGVCKDSSGDGEFQYGIGLYSDGVESVPDGFQEVCLPEQIWAVFHFKVSTATTVQNAWDCIKKDWYQNEEYGVVAGFSLEYYSSEDSCEIWIPVRKKVVE